MIKQCKRKKFGFTISRILIRIKKWKNEKNKTPSIFYKVRKGRLTESFALDLFIRNRAWEIHVIGFLLSFGMRRVGCISWNRGSTWRYKTRHYSLLSCKIKKKKSKQPRPWVWKDGEAGTAIGRKLQLWGWGSGYLGLSQGFMCAFPKGGVHLFFLFLFWSKFSSGKALFWFSLL